METPTQGKVRPMNNLQVTNDPQVMKRVRTAYSAVCDLGVALAEAGHYWQPSERKAWERAERALRPAVQS